MADKVQAGQIAPDAEAVEIQQKPGQQDHVEMVQPESNRDDSDQQLAEDQSMGYGGFAVKYWELASIMSFFLGSSCYMVNGAYWFHFKYRYNNFKKQTTTLPPAINASNVTQGVVVVSGNDNYEYYNYYFTKQEEIDEIAQWWEVAGAVLYMINPLLEFGTGSLKELCTNESCKQKTRAEAFWSFPWTPIGSILFLVASTLYLVNVFVPLLAKDGYDDTTYAVVDFFAALAFVVDACVYLIARLGRKREQIGTSDETSYLCCGPKYRGCLYVDWGFWGDIFFLLGAAVETVDHFHYTNELNMVACVLWWADACLYIVEWIIVHKPPICRLAHRSSVGGADDSDDVEFHKNPTHDDIDESEQSETDNHPNEKNDPD